LRCGSRRDRPFLHARPLRSIHWRQSRPQLYDSGSRFAFGEGHHFHFSALTFGDTNMRRLLFSTIAITTLAFGAAGAMAQPAPVPNASGSQTTNPATYRATANQQRAQQPTMKKRQVVKRRPTVQTTGSIAAPRRSMYGSRAVPVPNASGSQVTSPETYGATAYQYRRR
jgi:hypothetical protein